MGKPKFAVSLSWLSNGFVRGFAAVIGLVWCISSACKNEMKDIEALTGKINPQEDHAYDVMGYYSKGGNIKMKLLAKEFTRNQFSKPPYIDLNNNLKVDFYNDSTGEPENVLTADSCRYYEAEGNILIWGNVQIVRKKTNERLNTSELIWNQSIQKFFTEKPVTITTGTDVLHGAGMEANQDFTWYQITKPKGTVKVDKGEMPE
jgi:LPS export ABC transporter protein LptC